MKILVLKSSGNQHGSSNLLAAEFIRGAEESGNEIEEYDVFHANIHACSGCTHCGMNGSCVQKDDYENELKQMICDADMLVFVMPIYYFNWPAQMKAVIDRFYSFTTKLSGMHKKSVLIAAAWDESLSTFEIVISYYKKICSYMGFNDQGMIIGSGCGTPSMTKKTSCPQASYELGRSIQPLTGRR